MKFFELEQPPKLINRIDPELYPSLVKLTDDIGGVYTPLLEAHPAAAAQSLLPTLTAAMLFMGREDLEALHYDLTQVTLAILGGRVKKKFMGNCTKCGRCL